jgi:glycosyltransferase involved in cell wall biosynthesis
LTASIEREPRIAYILLRNAHFGPRLAASVELCVRDLVLHSRYARSTLVVCPPVDPSFEGMEIATIPDASIAGNLGKAWSVARLLKRRGVDLAIVENHLPGAVIIALASGLPVILHSHAYEKAPSGALDRAVRGQRLGRLSGFAFVSEDCANRFRANFPRVRAPMRSVPNGLDMADWSCPIAKDRTILCVGRALGGKGHIEAMAAIARALQSRPEWKARFILSDAAAADREPETFEALYEAAKPFGGRVRIDRNLPYADVKAAWESAAVGIVLTKGSEPFGRTALEALAGGAALITSGLGGLAEICGDCAVTVNPNDADLVAAALAGLMDEPERRANLARAGRKRVEALFDIRTVARRMDELIEACLGDGRAGD